MINELLANIEKIHTTDLGLERIQKNLSLQTDDVVSWCKEQILSPEAEISRNGKNWYVNVARCIITVNAYSYTIITAHKAKMTIRTATLEDLETITAVEAECFPNTEAATKEEFQERLTYYGNHFWLLYENSKLIAFVDGFVTNKPDLTDEMYAKASMHDEKGDWQMIFGVNTRPSYRQNGYAGKLIKRAIADAKKQGRKGLVLTCKDKLVHYYAKFGFVNEGVSESEHGNVVWNQMRLTF